MTGTHPLVGSLLLLALLTVVHHDMTTTPDAPAPVTEQVSVSAVVPDVTEASLIQHWLHSPNNVTRNQHWSEVATRHSWTGDPDTLMQWLYCPAVPQSALDPLTPITKQKGVDPHVIPAHLAVLGDPHVRSDSPVCLQQHVHSSLVELMTAARQDGQYVMVVSSYRPAALQQVLRQRRLEQGYSQTTVDNSIAMPGHSEHQLGTAVDFASTRGGIVFGSSFANTREYAWLREHAREFGFVQSYTTRNRAESGVIAEPWHWRYIGRHHAAAMHEQDLTLGEYLRTLEPTSEQATVAQ